MREQFASWVKSIAVAYKRKGSKQARRPFQEGGERARLEALEVRQLLSVTVQELAGPLEDAGSTWTYDDDPNDPSGSTDVQTNTSEGLNGSKLRMDINVASFDAGSNTSSSVSGIATYGFVSSGLVLYDQAAAGAVGTDGTIDFSPFELILPSVMDVGPHFYVNDSTQTVIDDQGKVKDTQVHIEIQLLTPTPSVTVMAMGQPFQCYEVETTETDTPAGMSAEFANFHSRLFFAERWGGSRGGCERPDKLHVDPDRLPRQHDFGLPAAAHRQRGQRRYSGQS